MFLRLLLLELCLKARNLYALLLPAVLLLNLVLLFPLALTPASDQLTALAPGICWLAVLLSLMLQLDRIFREDKEQGALDMLLAADMAIYSLVARMLAHWLLLAVPLCMLATLLGFILGMKGEQLARLTAALGSGSAVLICMGTTIASLCVGASRATMLIGVLLLPLLTPVVIFGVEASKAEPGGWQLVLLLFGCACINLVIAPLLSSAALRASLD